MESININLCIYPQSSKISMTSDPVKRDNHKKRTLKDGKSNKGGLFFILIRDMHENHKQHHS